jgi:hypothetical protein
LVMDRGNSVQENTIVNDFIVYPNPTTDFVELSYNLNTTENVSVKIIDITGSVVYQNFEGKIPAGKRTARIDVSDFASGIYSIQLQINNKTVTRKIVIN